MASVRPEAHWRDSARTPKFFMIDYRAVFPLLLWIFYPTLITFIVCVVAMLAFTMLERFGYTLPIYLRYLRSSILAGKVKTAKPWWL